METSGSSPSGALSCEDLVPLVEHAGPFATVYVATEASVDNAAQGSVSHWKPLRQELATRGAPEALLSRIDELVPDAHLSGQALAVVAAEDELLLVEHHPQPPRRELAVWGALPALAPLIELRQAQPPHVVVIADRTGAQIVATGSGPGEAGGAQEIEKEVNSSRDARSRQPRKVKAGGWSERRYQQRAENSWEDSASDVAAEVQRLADLVRAETVIVAGDVRAVQLMREALPDRIGELMVEIDGSRGADGGEESMATDLHRMVATAAARQTVTVLEKFRQERAQADLASDGPVSTFAALREARVDVLLVHDDPDDERTAWFGAAPTALGITADEARDAAPGEPVLEGRLIDIAIRAALGTGAGIRVVPIGYAAPQQGVGGILRWRVPAPA